MDEKLQPGTQLTEAAEAAAEAAAAEITEAAEPAAAEITEAAEPAAAEIAEAAEPAAAEIAEATAEIPEAADAEQAEEVLSPEAAFAEAMMADTRPAEDLPIVELPLAEKPVRSADPEKKERTAKIVVLSIVGALLLGLLVLAIVLALSKNAKSGDASANAGESGQSTGELTDEEVGEHSRVDMNEMMKYGPFAYTDTSLSENYNAQIAARVGDHELTGGMLQIFYWSMVYQDLNENADYLSFRGPDTTRPFAEQKYGETVNWEQHYLQTALDYYLQNVSLYDEAVRNGVTLSAETQEKIDTLPENLAAQAAQYGFENVEDYLAESYGPAVRMEDLTEYYKISSLAFAYATQLQQDISVTPEEISDFYDAHAEQYAAQGVEKTDQNVVNVRHILAMPEQDVDSDGDGTNDSSSDDAWAAAEGRINTIYEDWKKEPTEDNFADLASSMTDDTGSAGNGGLYENIYPGQMVEEFANWCFDAARKPGDTDIVRTQYGYHLMYFSSEGDRPYWQIVAEEECVYEKFNKIIDELFSKYEIKPDYENLHLFDTIAYNNAKSAAETGE